MITLRKFFVVLLALTTLVVAAYAVYEMTPERRVERRARRVAARLKRLLYDECLEDPERDIREGYYTKRRDKLLKELSEFACRCEAPLAETGPRAVSWWRYSGVHKEGCLYPELIKEVTDYYGEFWWK